MQQRYAQQTLLRLKAAQARVTTGAVVHAGEVATVFAAPTAWFCQRLFAVMATTAAQAKYAAANRKGMADKLAHNRQCLRQAIGFEPERHTTPLPGMNGSPPADMHAFAYQRRRTHVRGSTRRFADPDLVLCGAFWHMQLTSWIAMQPDGRYRWTDEAQVRLAYVVSMWESYAAGELDEQQCSAQARFFPESRSLQCDG
jgi:hypothetical protein